MVHSAPEKLVGALVNGAAILGYLQKTSGGVGVTQVARDPGINPSTCCAPWSVKGRRASIRPQEPTGFQWVWCRWRRGRWPVIGTYVCFTPSCSACP